MRTSSRLIGWGQSPEHAEILRTSSLFTLYFCFSNFAKGLINLEKTKQPPRYFKVHSTYAHVTRSRAEHPARMGWKFRLLQRTAAPRQRKYDTPEIIHKRVCSSSRCAYNNANFEPEMKFETISARSLRKVGVPLAAFNFFYSTFASPSVTTGLIERTRNPTPLIECGLRNALDQLRYIKRMSAIGGDVRFSSDPWTPLRTCASRHVCHVRHVMMSGHAGSCKQVTSHQRPSSGWLPDYETVVAQLVQFLGTEDFPDSSW